MKTFKTYNTIGGVQDHKTGKWDLELKKGDKVKAHKNKAYYEGTIIQIEAKSFFIKTVGGFYIKSSFSGVSFERI